MSDKFKSFELKIENHLAYTHTGAMGFGTCLPLGQVREGDGFHLEDRRGGKLPVEWRPLLKEADGTVRWAYFNFPVTLRTLEFRHYRLRSGALPEHEKLDFTENGNEITIRNGAVEYVFAPAAPLGLKSLSQNGAPLLDGERAGATMRCDETEYTMRRPLALSLKSRNSFEVVVQALGELAPHDGSDGIYFRVLYTIQLGKPGLNVNVYFSNRRRNDAELTLQSLAVSFGLASPVRRSAVQQLSTDNLCYPQFHELEGGVSITGGRLSDPQRLTMPDTTDLYPFFKKFDKESFFGRVAPYAGLRLDGGGVAFSWRRATIQETSTFAAQADTSTLELVSPTPEGRRLPQGVSRSVEFSITPFAADADCEAVYAPAARGENQPLIAVHPQWYIDNEVECLHRYLPYLPDKHPRYERMLWREYAKGYYSGFYNYGDYPTQRGSAEYLAAAKKLTWNNNEEDLTKGIALMFMRTGDPTYLEDLRFTMKHQLEVDRLAYSSHPLQNGILIAHAQDHFDGCGYPSHCWAEGILLYYKLTGDEDALDAFFHLCDCLLEWSKIPEGTRYADGREMGVRITNLAHAYKLSGDEKYLNATREFINYFRGQMERDGGLYYKLGPMRGRYAEYVAVEGLFDYYELIGGEDVKQLLLDIIDWIDRECCDQFGSYDARAVSLSMLHIYYIGYHLTGDEAWLEKGRQGLKDSLGEYSGIPLLNFDNNAEYYHEAYKRGWFDDDWVPTGVPGAIRAVFRTYSEPDFGWEKQGIRYND